VDVRLALLAAALALGALAGDVAAIVRTFLLVLADEKFVVPICCAMGFAYVLKHTRCDQHLVHLLVEPLRKVRAFLIPGAVLVGFVVNIPIISQTSTAVTIGSVLIPLLLAARISPVTVGAALLLGSSVGGELLNPGAPELRTTVEESQKAVRAAAPRPEAKGQDRNPVPPERAFTGARCVQRILPLILVQLVLATGIFWITSLRFEARWRQEHPEIDFPLETPGARPFRVNLGKALVPLVPLALLFLTAPPFEWLPVPRGWLVRNPHNLSELLKFDSRLIGAAMLVGVAVATLAAPRSAPGVARAFFDGAGYAYTNIISLIVIASCLGEGIKLIGLAEVIGRVVQGTPALLLAAAGSLPFGFAVLCGSGMAATQSLFGFFALPAVRLDIDPAHVGAVVSIAAAAGRTMSPVAAVTLMSATLTGTSPVDLMKRVALPLAAGALVMVLVAALMAPSLPLDYTD
jgi:DcuC family C4-dicarboxylate transporter